MKIRDKIAKLIDLKSIITLIMVITLSIGWFVNKVTSDQFVPLVTMILTFYFARNNTSSTETNPNPNNIDNKSSS